MESGDGKNDWGDTSWDPVHDKTFKSMLHVEGEDLDVRGCVSIVCVGQDWKRVK